MKYSKLLKIIVLVFLLAITLKTAYAGYCGDGECNGAENACWCGDCPGPCEPDPVDPIKPKPPVNPDPVCGDGIVNGDDTCELKNTFNNQYCSQSTETCSGTKLGTRDSYGDCNSDCGCNYDIFVYQCVEGSCGLQHRIW